MFNLPTPIYPADGGLSLRKEQRIRGFIPQDTNHVHVNHTRNPR